jgi:hypothetical protein
MFSTTVITATVDWSNQILRVVKWSLYNFWGVVLTDPLRGNAMTSPSMTSAKANSNFRFI